MAQRPHENLFSLICSDLYDFCPLGHSFFTHHIVMYRKHHFQLKQVEIILWIFWVATNVSTVFL